MNPEEKKNFQEYLTNQRTVVKPYCCQRQNHICGTCLYHIRTGKEESLTQNFRGSLASHTGQQQLPQNKYLLFYELRSFSGRVVQKGHATNCTDQDNHPESMLFEVGGYLDAVTDAYENIRCIILRSDYFPCNEAYHCCVSKIYNFLLKYQEVTFSIYFSQLYHTENSFPTAMWNCEALWSPSSLWPQVTLQRLSGWGGNGITSSAILYMASQGQHFIIQLDHQEPQQIEKNPHQINNLTEMKTYFRKAFPQAIQGKPAVLQKLKAFSSSPAFQQPFQMLKSSLLPLMSQSHPVLFPGMFLPFQREQLYPRPKNIIRHLKMPKEQSN